MHRRHQVDAEEEPSPVNARELCLRVCKPCPHHEPAWGSDRPTCAPPRSQTQCPGPWKSRREMELWRHRAGLASSPSSGLALPPAGSWMGLTSVSWPRGFLLQEAAQGQRAQPDPIKQNRAGPGGGWASPPTDTDKQYKAGAPRGPRTFRSRCLCCQISLGYGSL